jgi:PadR family transcriptional regulator PadR
MAPKMTAATRALLRALLDAAGEPVYGLELGREAGLATGTLYPVLHRLTREGWIEASWEEADPSALGRPRRRFYRLTALGEVAAYREVQAVPRPARAAFAPRPIPLVR